MGIGAALGAGVAVLAAGAALAVSTARAIVTPPRDRVEDIVVLAVDRLAGEVRLSCTADTVLAGRYSLWFDRDRGHARVGRVLHEDSVSVTRVLESVQRGALEAARTARWGGWYHLVPGDVGAVEREVSIRTPIGDAPAWLIPADGPPDGDGTDWVIQVHGRGVTRAEGLRAVPVFRSSGWTSLLISYRNDGEGPASADGRYALGSTEWLDLEAAVASARDHGARRIVIMGWSMGGAITLQFLVRSPLAEFVHGVVLDSPVIEWATVLRFHAALAGIPRPVGEVAMALLGVSAAVPLIGSAEPIDLRQLDLVARADELRVPMLVLHSDDDGFVPIDATLALAEARPDIVTVERFTVARHARLWNFDPDRWEGAIRAWLNRIEGPSGRTGPRRRR